MGYGNKFLAVGFLAASLAAPLITTGCAHHYTQVYDPYYTDYHRWGPDEEVYYRQWTNERHYEYKDYNHLDKDQQKDYWNWRHSHGDHDHDHDHDKH